MPKILQSQTKKYFKAFSSKLKGIKVDMTISILVIFFSNQAGQDIDRLVVQSMLLVGISKTNSMEMVNVCILLFNNLEFKLII